MKRTGAIALVLMAGMLSGAVAIQAQGGDETCPALVETALASVGEACEGLGRNEACYGHELVAAIGWEQAPLAGFETPGDVADVGSMASLATFPLDAEAGTWGIALLRLQADLPETLPGQGVTFVLYGDAGLRSEVPPEDQAASSPTCVGTTGGGTNLRVGPGTNHAVAGSVGAGEALNVSGRNAAGDWLRVAFRDRYAWAYAPLLSLDCEVETLPEVAGSGPLERTYDTPMQAFYLVTGFGEPACEEAPRDGLLVQAPRETSVHFLINGIEVAVGSTALVQIDEDVLGVNTFAGTVSVTSAGRTQTAAPGQRVDVVAGEAPAAPVPYDPDDVANAPVDLLPEPVEIPPPAIPQVGRGLVNFNFVACEANGGQFNLGSIAGQTVRFQQGVARFPTTAEAEAARGGTYPISIDGVALDVLNGPVVWQEGGGVPTDTGPNGWGFNAIADWVATPGTHTAVTNNFSMSFTCALTVEP